MKKHTAQNYLGKDVKILTNYGWYLATLKEINDSSVNNPKQWRAIVEIKSLICHPSAHPLESGKVWRVTGRYVFPVEHQIPGEEARS